MATLPYSTVISPNDHMWRTEPREYFDVGLSAVSCIARALSLARVAPTAILDLPCGHGRVARMLRAAFPDAPLTVCDLDRNAVDFCASQFDAEPLYAEDDVRGLSFTRSFDLIWCGSLFTHLDRHRWHDFLGVFAAHLEPGGVLVFTTHGRQPVQWMLEGRYNYGLSLHDQHHLIASFATTGFGFVQPIDQAFGISLSSPALVCSEVERLPALKLVGLHEAGWFDHQDVVSCVKQLVPFPDAASGASALAPVPIASGPAPHGPLGNIDAPRSDIGAAGSLTVCGWAADERGIREVRILWDGRLLDVLQPSIERPDVSAVHPSFRRGHDRHGWRIEVALDDPGAHILSAEAINVDGVAADLGSRVIRVPDAGRRSASGSGL